MREIYTLRLCYGLLDDCFEVGGWVSFMPILTDSEMSIRGVSAVPWFVERAGPAWDQNLLSAISGDCNQKDAGKFWTCWWITRWRHLKVQPFSNVWWNYTRLNDSGIEQLVIFHDMNQLAKTSWPDFFHGTSIRQASIQFRRRPDFEERNLTVKING